MRRFKYRILVLLLGFAFCNSVMATQGEVVDLMYDFQFDQLMDPSEEQLQLEKEGYVFIYEGLKDSDIELALDRYQDRMGSMMFVNIIWTNEAGEPLVDPYTGQPVVDNDC